MRGDFNMKKKGSIRIPRLIAIAIVILGIYLFVTALAVRFPFGIENISMETWNIWRAHGYAISRLTVSIGVLIFAIDAVFNKVKNTKKAN